MIAELGLADHLSSGPQTADVLAELTHTKPAALRRLQLLHHAVEVGADGVARFSGMVVPA